MRPLSFVNVESELSYAYLHAVASQARCACKVSSRHEDNAGVDAHLVGWGPFAGGGSRTEVDLKIQLKATIIAPAVVDGHFAYRLRGIAQYDDLRSPTVATPRILVVLYMPPDSDEWIECTDEALVLRRCAYWVSLRGARASSNASTQTVYIPSTQRFDGPGLLSLMSRLSRNEVPLYEDLSA